MIVNILLIVFVLLRFIIGVRLFLTARQNNLPNLYWLAVQFILVSVGASFAPSQGNPLAGFSFSLWVFIIVSGFIVQVTNIGFNQATFYAGRKSPILWYAGLSALCIGTAIYGLSVSESNYNQHPLVAFNYVGVMLLWIWHGQAAAEALATVTKDEAVEDWVKSRYQLIVAYAIVLGIAATGSFVRAAFAGGATTNPLGNAMALITLLAQLVGTTLQFLVWVMPEGFRTWLNRNQKAREVERIHQRAIAVLDIIGSAMSDGTGLSKMVGLYAIRKTIGMDLNTEDAAQIEEHAHRMGYTDWLNVLRNPELAIQIKHTAAPDVRIRDVITKAENVLVERQSLFTLQAK